MKDGQNLSLQVHAAPSYSHIPTGDVGKCSLSGRKGHACVAQRKVLQGPVTVSRQRQLAWVGYSDLLPCCSLLPLSSAGCSLVVAHRPILWASPVYSPVLGAPCCFPSAQCQDKALRQGAGIIFHLD